MGHKPRTLIAGAGIGGLVAALALLKAGFEVKVFEQASELKEIGAGLQIAANGMKVLRSLGLGTDLLKEASSVDGKCIRLWNTGQVWSLFDLAVESVERYGAPYFMFHRADLHTALLRAVERENPDAIRIDAKVTDVTERDGSVAIRLSGGEEVEGDVLIGADGVHSAVRHRLFGGDNPRFTGMLAWRGIIPAERLPEGLRRPVGTNWIGPGRHVIHYPVRRGTLINFVGIVERQDWLVESWTTQGTREECANDFRGWHEDVQTLIASIETPFKWALMGRDPMQRWSRGRVTLLGDACHPTLPFLAQGAGMAIEDGCVVARCLALFPDEPVRALALYEKARIARTTRVVQGSAENGRRFHNPALADAAGAAAYVEREFAPALVRARYDWLFEYDATTSPIDRDPAEPGPRAADGIGAEVPARDAHAVS